MRENFLFGTFGKKAIARNLSTLLFWHGRDIPLQTIKALKKENSATEMFHPEDVSVFFVDATGKEDSWTLSFNCPKWYSTIRTLPD